MIPHRLINKLNWLVWLSVLLLTFLIHISFLNNGFTWLDHGDVEYGRAILPINYLQSAFLTRFGETGFY